ncbi:hypothetical protein KBTX_03899 [wastewater metagenome]|uniref:Uncharacterized protein n=2 Tax=unclassified sequences TaxID=12908 RepID=A0A5B8RFY6_9ZZZZ|nr:hypothetical protein KBTEX_03899 [uncultured organism]
MTNLDRATNNKKEDDNFERAGIIARTVSAKAYDLLKDCKEPEPAFDGYDEYLKEHWEIGFNELHYEVVIELQNEWEFEEGDDLDQQILFHVEQFMDSDEYETLKERVWREYYQYEEDKRDWEQTKRAHQPTWRPKRYNCKAKLI